MMMKSLTATVLGWAFFSTLLSVSAAPVWSLPESGIRLDNQEKQIFMANKMSNFFNPQDNSNQVDPFVAPDDWIHTTFELDDLLVERLTNTQSNSSRIVLQLHGGGYIDGLHDLYRELAVKQAVLSEAKEVYLLHYRLAPKNVFPAALEDAVKIYQYLLKNGNESRNIIIFGDSAGGNLALELSIFLKEKKISQPRMLILTSPWTTFETTFNSRKQNADRDTVLGRVNARMFSEVANPSYGGKMSLSDSRLSPIYANLSDLPPMLIQVGGYELFLDEGIELLKKAATDDVNVTLSVYQGMPHDFALVMPELQESVDSFAEIKSFVDRNMH